MTVPQEILIKSDGNKLQFVSEKKGIYTYQYSISKTKKGLTVEFDESQLTKLINTNS